VRAAALALRPRPGLTLTAASGVCLAAVIASAALAALVAVAAGTSHANPHDAIDDSPGAVAALFAHNAAVAWIPLGLAALGWDRARSLHLTGDAVVLASLIANGAVVGYALARAGPELAAYLPHLPFEWTAIALPAGAWLCLRRGCPDPWALLLQTLALSAAALLVAALIEVYAVPLG
jgi:hypothetical protein